MRLWGRACCSRGQWKVLERGWVKREHGPEHLQAPRARVQTSAHTWKIFMFKSMRLAYELLTETVSLLLPWMVSFEFGIRTPWGSVPARGSRGRAAPRSALSARVPSRSTSQGLPPSPRGSRQCGCTSPCIPAPLSPPAGRPQLPGTQGWACHSGFPRGGLQHHLLENGDSDNIYTRGLLSKLNETRSMPGPCKAHSEC